MKKYFLFLLLPAFWAAVGAGDVFALQIEGIVLSENGLVADAVVTAYQDYTSLRNGRDGIPSTPGEKPGQYRISLPQGSYYLVARGRDESGNPLYGYHGLNPLKVEDAYRWVPLMVLRPNKTVCEPGFQGVGGRVLYKGTPAADSSISVYALDDEPFRGMGLLTNTVPEDGSFWFDLDPGSYVLVARKRINGGAIGPIKKGDLLCYFSGNPIQILPAQSCTVDIACYPRDDLDSFFVKGAADPRGKKEEKRRASSLRDTDETDSARVPGAGTLQQPAVLLGRVTDLAGVPLANLYISAYPADDVPLFQMYILRLKTKHMTRTNRQGFFRLELNSGSYYLVAREKVGDAPQSGEYYGIYEGTPNHSIKLEPNEIKARVHIVAESIMP